MTSDKRRSIWFAIGKRFLVTTLSATGWYSHSTGMTARFIRCPYIRNGPATLRPLQPCSASRFISRPIRKARRLIAPAGSHYCVGSGHFDSQRVPIPVDLAVVGIETQTVLMTKLLGDQVKSLLQV